MSGSNSRGFKVKIFADDIPNNLLCFICKKVLNLPSQCQNGHLFCFSCICEELALSDGCPVEECDSHLTTEKLGKSVFVRELIGALQSFCPSCDSLSENIDHGCQWVGEFRSRDAHYMDDCEYFLCLCPNEGCTDIVQRRHLDAHAAECEYRVVECQYCANKFQFRELCEHKTVCESRPVECDNGCGLVMAFNKIASHKLSDCPLQLVECPLSRMGMCENCPEQLPRRDLKEHIAGAVTLSDTVLSLVTHTSSQTDSSARLSAMERKVELLMNTVTALTAENITLSANIVTLSDNLHTHMQLVKTQKLCFSAQLADLSARLTSVDATVADQCVDSMRLASRLDSALSVTTITAPQLSALQSQVRSTLGVLDGILTSVNQQPPLSVPPRTASGSRLASSAAPARHSGHSSFPSIAPLNAMQLVRELGMNDNEVEDVQSEIYIALRAWAEVVGGCDIAVTVTAKDCVEGGVLELLLTGLGITFNAEETIEQLLTVLTGDRQLSAHVFVNWYVRWLFQCSASDSSDDVEIKTQNMTGGASKPKSAAASTPPPPSIGIAVKDPVAVSFSGAVGSASASDSFVMCGPFAALEASKVTFSFTGPAPEVPHTSTSLFATTDVLGADLMTAPPVSMSTATVLVTPSTCSSSESVLLSATRYAQVLGLDVDEVEDVQSEIDNALQAWVEIVGDCDTITITTDDYVEDGVLGQLLTRLGTTFIADEHGEQFTALLTSNCSLSAHVFADWYIRWLCTNDSDAGDSEEDGLVE